MKNIEISFITNNIYEISASMYRIANSDQIESSYFENSGYKSNPRIKEVLNALVNELPHLYQTEICFFFSNPLCFGNILWKLIEQYDIKEFRQLIEKLTDLTDEEVINIMLANTDELLSTCTDDDSDAMKPSLLDNMIDFEEKVKTSDDLSSIEKDRIFELCRFPSDAKQRFIRLLERYYIIFSKFIPELESACHTEMKHSQKVYKKNPDTFFTHYIKISDSIITPDSTVVMIPSYFSEILTYVIQPKPDKIILVYGAFISKKRLYEKENEERQQFLKILSEEKRVDIIKRLAIQPSMGRELAKQLGLTSATASYHLSMLQAIGIVEYQRIGSKLHYTLNKDVLKELFDKAYANLTYL